MKLALAVTAATFAALLTPVAAHADSYSRNDPSGDVVKSVFDPDGVVRQPARADGDIVRSAVTHGPRRVTMALRMRAIGRAAGQETIYDFRIGTRRAVREVILTAEPDRWQGHVDFYDGRGSFARCKGIRWSIRYSTGMVTASVPRRCLGRPAAVHVGMGVGNLDARNDLFSDDAATDGQEADPVRWGPWVAR